MLVIMKRLYAISLLVFITCAKSVDSQEYFFNKLFSNSLGNPVVSPYCTDSPNYDYNFPFGCELNEDDYDLSNLGLDSNTDYSNYGYKIIYILPDQWTKDVLPNRGDKNNMQEESSVSPSITTKNVEETTRFEDTITTSTTTEVKQEEYDDSLPVEDTNYSQHKINFEEGTSTKPTIIEAETLITPIITTTLITPEANNQAETSDDYNESDSEEDEPSTKSVGKMILTTPSNDEDNNNSKPKDTLSWF